MLDVSDWPWSETNFSEKRIISTPDSLSLKRRKRGNDAHRYEWELVTTALDGVSDNGRELRARMSRATTDYELIEFIHPRQSYSQGTIPSENILSNNDYAKGLKEIAFKSTGIWQLKAGDYLTFSSHTKVYEISETTGLDDGVQVINLTFGLRQAVQENEVITVNGVKWTLESDTVISTDINASNGQFFQMSYNLVESL